MEGIDPTRPTGGGHRSNRITGPRAAAGLASLRRSLPDGGSLPLPVWQTRHRSLLVLLWLHVPALFLFGVLRGESVLHALLEAAAVGGFAGLAHWSRRLRSWSTAAVASGLMTASAVLVHLSGGQIEAHFHYFVMVGVVTLYQDWRPFLVAFGSVVFHHGVLGVLMPASVYSHTAAVDAPWRWAAVHGLFIIGMSAAGIASWRHNEILQRETVEQHALLVRAEELARLGSWSWDLRTDVVRCSPVTLALLDIQPSAWTGRLRQLFRHVRPEDRREVTRALLSLRKGGPDSAIDLRVATADGTHRWLQARGAVTASDRGRPTVISGTVQDISDRKRSEDELRSAASLLAATLDATGDGILVIGADRVVSSVNQRFLELWGLPGHALAAGDASTGLSDLVAQVRDPDTFVAKVAELEKAPDAESHDAIELLDGRRFERDSRPQRVDGKTVGRVWSFRDVTQRHQLEEALVHQAFHDALTGLANPALFRDRVDHALARARSAPASVAVLFIDLDNFKTVNDSLGHRAGDELLIEVAHRILGCLRPQDTAARQGGDEFTVLIEGLGDPRDAEAGRVADSFLAALRAPVRIDGRDVYIGASVGLSFGTAGCTADQLLRNADLAMYTAKQRGRNRVEVFDPSMHQVAVERLEIEGDLRRAIDAGELEVHYQPIVDLGTGTTTGVEALVRWNHPERGMLPPAMFIPLAEETGLICELGWQVLERACKEVRTWQQLLRRPLSLSVNLSPRQLQDDRLLERVTGALAQSGLPARDLLLEITEGAMMQDTEATIAKLHSLKGLGLRLAVDDFGTGYSSLSYLQRFPIDVLKVDRAFVASISPDPESSLLARSILALAATLGLRTVAEGIETAEQRDAIALMGCDLGQGYLFSKPLDATALTDHLHGEGLDGHPSPDGSHDVRTGGSAGARVGVATAPPDTRRPW